MREARLERAMILASKHNRESVALALVKHMQQTFFPISFPRSARGAGCVERALGEGTTEKVSIMRSGYSSRILLISSVPMPDPVPPPSECATWKPAPSRVPSGDGHNEWCALWRSCQGPVVQSSVPGLGGV